MYSLNFLQRHLPHAVKRKKCVQKLIFMRTAALTFEHVK